MTENSAKKPEWLKVKVSGGMTGSEVTGMLRELGLHTVCEAGPEPAGAGQRFHDTRPHLRHEAAALRR